MGGSDGGTDNPKTKCFDHVYLRQRDIKTGWQKKCDGHNAKLEPSQPESTEHWVRHAGLTWLMSTSIVG